MPCSRAETVFVTAPNSSTIFNHFCNVVRWTISTSASLDYGCGLIVVPVLGVFECDIRCRDCVAFN